MKKVMSYYQQELNRCLEKYKDIMLKLENKVIIVAGSSGMIGKCIIDILMQFNSSNEKKIKILALSKNKDFAYERFGEYINKEYFCYKQCDITKPLSDYGYVDYIIHCADDYNNGIKSFSCSIDGIRNMLLYGERYRTKKLCFVSTDEVYGECEIDRYKESDMGIFDCTQYRSIYIEGKRAAEAFLKHFCEYCELEYVICRIAKCFGPTIHKKNKKMIHQFLYRAAGNDVIELKSDGKQKFSFIHVIDAAIGVLISMLIGQAGEIYNISNEKNEFTVRELAERISLYTDFKGNIVQNIADGEKQNFQRIGNY